MLIAFTVLFLWFCVLIAIKTQDRKQMTVAQATWEEGVGDGRSVWSETLGLHAAYSGWNNGLPLRKEELIP